MPIKETERIVNISELEKMIQNARLKVIAASKAAQSDMPVALVHALEDAQKILLDCEKFEFILERKALIVNDSTHDEMLKEHALPICEHLAQNATPYTTVVINSSEVRVMEDVLGIPAKEYDHP